MRVTRRGAWLAGLMAAAAIPAEAGQNSERAAAVVPSAALCAATLSPSPETAAGPPVLVEGLGYAGIAPDTANAEARRWFEQGVRLVWAYDEAEAVRAFGEAQKLDPGCALCAWGEAWARGPTLNLQPRTEEHGAAAAAARRAAALAERLGERDRALVAAMLVRVGTGGRFDDKGYRKAMAGLAGRFASDDAVLVMAADSEMIVSARRGRLKEGSAAQGWLETVIARNPEHSGAIHLYIHLSDFIDRQKLAEPYADRLGRLAPSASHLVHMPSHTFYGVGRYADAAAVNVAALAAGDSYARRASPPPSDYRTGLSVHNSHFAIESALMRGDGRVALAVADQFADRFPAGADSPFRAVIRSSTWYAYGLHADPAKVLAMPEPEPGRATMRAMRHYGRGEAFARQGDSAGVKAEAAALAAFLAGPEARGLGHKSVETLLAIAQKVLEGRAAMIERRFADAAAAYRKAMVMQGKAGFGSDPPPFWYGTRRSLGAALLASGEAESARLQFAQTLRDWPDDPLALYGLARAEAALRDAAASSHLARAKAGWAGDDLDARPLALL